MTLVEWPLVYDLTRFGAIVLNYGYEYDWNGKLWRQWI